MVVFQGVIISEGLSDPTIIKNFEVYKAEITRDGIPIDYDGNLGRWHLYYVKCSKQEIDEFQPYILHGWYAHFWQRNRIVVVYNDRQFEITKDNRSTWKEAIEHGKAQGIPENEFGFPTD